MTIPITAAERLAGLQEFLNSYAADKSILSGTDSRIRWIGRVVPLLNFSEFHHANALVAADYLARPHLSTATYDTAKGRLLLVIHQAVSELERDIRPPEAPQPPFTLTDENGVWWFINQCTTKTRCWVIAKAAAAIGIAAALGYFSGSNHFFRSIVEIFRTSFNK